MQVRKSSELEGCKGVMTSLTAAISAGISWAVRGVSSVCDVTCVYLICIWRLQPYKFWRDQFWSQRSLSGRCCTRALSLVLQLIGSSQIELLSCIHKIWLDGLCVGCFIEITRWWKVSKHSDKVFSQGGGRIWQAHRPNDIIPLNQSADSHGFFGTQVELLEHWPMAL